MVGKVALKAFKNRTTILTKRKIMTTETKNTPTEISIATSANVLSAKIISKLEENKGNAIKPLSLRPNRSFKKNLSLKPVGFKSR
jgi:hypothetical protein